MSTVEKLEADNAQLHRQLTIVQERCTELLLEVRSLRRDARVVKEGDSLQRVFGDVLFERYRQDAKWGGIDSPNQRAVCLGEPPPDAKDCADAARVNCDLAMRAGNDNWRLILEEEFWEAMAESDPAKMRAEIIQLAAVCVNVCQLIDQGTK
jgi:hypothetical protein